MVIASGIGYLLKHVLYGELSAWVQAVGATLAIVVGFTVANNQAKAQQDQLQSERAAVAQAAQLLAFEALETVGGRLEAALMPPGSGKILSLQGDRTTEMILALREFETSRLPAVMLTPFIRLRSHVYAINERISEIFDSEETSNPEKNKENKARRHARLKSTVRVRKEAVALFEELQEAAKPFGVTPQTPTIHPRVADYEHDLTPKPHSL